MTGRRRTAYIGTRNNNMTSSNYYILFYIQILSSASYRAVIKREKEKIRIKTSSVSASFVGIVRDHRWAYGHDCDDDDDEDVRR